MESQSIKSSLDQGHPDRWPGQRLYDHWLGPEKAMLRRGPKGCVIELSECVDSNDENPAQGPQVGRFANRPYDPRLILDKAMAHT